jgi:hypothetical protein
MKTYFPEDLVKQEMMEELIECLRLDMEGREMSRNMAIRIKNLVELATGQTIEELTNDN